jgi:hypothetical protein
LRHMLAQTQLLTTQCIQTFLISPPKFFQKYIIKFHQIYT